MQNYTITNFNEEYFKQIGQEELCYFGNYGFGKQLDSKQAWIYDFGFGLVLQSYNTLVGFLDYSKNTFYEFGKYSQTTSKQVTTLCRKLDCERVLL